MKSQTETLIELLARWIIDARHLIAFTGAGISTDSGIPDFRGPEGVWTRRDAGLPPPKWGVPQSKVQPNASHYALVDLQNMGRLQYLISQNTDGLHLRSGIEPQKLAELHGNGRLMRCLECDTQVTRESVGWDTNRWGRGYRTHAPLAGQPSCPSCKGRLISSVVNFGDPLPEKELKLATQHAKRCDLMLVLGSSLVVNPAAALVGIALRAKARVVLVNLGETPYDDVVPIRVWGGIAEVLPPTVQRIKTLMNVS